MTSPWRGGRVDKDPTRGADKAPALGLVDHGVVSSQPARQTDMCYGSECLWHVELFG